MNETTEQKTKYYGEDKETDRAVERLISREVLACQSSLVDALLAKEPFSQEGEASLLGDFDYGNIENLYPDPSKWSAERCQEWLQDEGHYSCEHDIQEDESPDEHTDRVREEVGDVSEAAEIFEWWLVTSYAADKLREQNEPILAVGDDIWWGRTCTGQSIALDPTWYDIYASVN